MRRIKVCFVIIMISIILFSGNNLGSKIRRIEKEMKNDVDSMELYLKLGKLYHQAARKDIDDYTDKGIKHFEEAQKKYPNNDLIKVWYGSILTIKGKNVFFPLKKRKYVKQGLNKMDKAVKNYPKKLTVRVVRAKNNIALPDFFNRKDTAKKDLKYIIDSLENNKNLKGKYNLPGMYYSLAKIYEDRDNNDRSIHLWKKIISKYPESEEASKSEKQLNTYEIE